MVLEVPEAGPNTADMALRLGSGKGQVVFFIFIHDVPHTFSKKRT